MSDQPEIKIDVRSNIDKLSEKAVHDTLVNYLSDELISGEDILRFLVPKREGDMAAHVGHKGPIDSGTEIEGSVGIPEIHKTGESDPLSAKYPLFTDDGTGIFGEHGTIFSKRGRDKFMYIPPQRSDFGGGFAHSVKGQEGHHFMFATFAAMVAMLQINGEKFKADLTAKLKSDQLT